MSRLVKSYLTSISGEHLLRIQPIEVSYSPPASPPLPQEDPNALLEKARREASQIILRAEEEAARREQEAALWEEQRRTACQNEIALVTENAKKQGWQEGYEAGLAAGQQETRSMIESATQLMEEAKSARSDFLAQSEPLLQTLAIAIAEKVIHAEISATPDLILNRVRTALLEIREKGLVEIRVSPEDYKVVLDNKSELVSFLSSQTEIVAVPDVAVTQGGCLIITGQESIDARIETGLEEVRKALKEISGGATH